MRKDIPYIALEMMFGGTTTTTLHSWFILVVKYIYNNSPILIRSRNLGNPNHMRAVLEELHAATMRCTRASTSYTPTMLEAARLNPLLTNHGKRL